MSQKLKAVSPLGKLNEVTAVKAGTKTQPQQGWGVNYPTHCRQMVRMHFFHTRANLSHPLEKLYFFHAFRNILSAHMTSCLT